MIDRLQENGALLSWREHADGTRTVYEVNVSLFDAFKQAGEAVDRTLDRMILAHAILLGLEGVPAIYLHSFVATNNDLSRVENTGHNRAINRHQWALEELTGLLNDAASQHAQCLHAIKHLIDLRQRQSAFHPNATQFTLNCGRSIFGFWRQSPDRAQSVFCLYNVTSTSTTIAAASLNLVGNDSWRDLISGEILDLLSEDPSIELAPYQAVWLTNTRT